MKNILENSSLTDSIFYTNEDGFVLNTTGIILVIIMIVLLMCFALAVFARRKSITNPGIKKAKMGTKQLTFSAMAMALGIVTSEFLPTLSLPAGGSITLFSMLFITIIGYWYGFGPGIATALAYGLLQFVLDPKFISPVQILLDYILAFGALGLSGLFHEKKDGLILGYLAGAFGRYFFAWLAGVTVWKAYTPEGTSAALYSLIYQGTYLIPEIIITVILLLIPAIKKGLTKIKQQATEI